MAPAPTGDILKFAIVETPETFSCLNVPTDVKEEFVTPLPRVAELNTDVPLISYCLPDTRLQSSLEVNAEALLFHVIVLRILAEPIPIPAPSRSKLVHAVVAIPICASAISTIEELMVVVVPSTYKSPYILTAPVLFPIADGSI